MPAKRKQPAAAETNGAEAAAPEGNGRRSSRAAAKKVNYNEDNENEDGESVEKAAPPKRARKAKKDAVVEEEGDEIPVEPVEEDKAAAAEEEEAPAAAEAEAEETKEEAPAAETETTKIADEVEGKAAEVAVGGEAEQTEDKDDGKVASDAKIAVGDSVPEFTLKTQEDKEISTKEIFEKGAVIFLVPKANTPGCTTQAEKFRDHHKDFTDAGYEVYSISQDSPKVLTGWKEKKSLPYTLLSDPKQQLIKALGGAKSAKAVNRSHFVVEKGGKLLLASIGVKPAESAPAALEFVKAL